MHGTRPLLAAVVLSTAIAGCGGGGSSHGLPLSELGTYVRPGGGTDISVALTLNADGRYLQVPYSGSPQLGIKGVWSFHNGRITLTETGGTGACVGQPGTYRWAYAKKILTLSVVSDSCAPWVRDIPIAPWRHRS